MGESSSSSSSISITKVCEQIEEDYKDNLPPWPEASFSEKIHILFLYLLISLPVFILLVVIIGGYCIFSISYIYNLVIELNDRPELFYWHTEEEQQFCLIKGLVLFGFETFAIFMVLFSHFKAMVTDPGAIPEEPNWNIPSYAGSDESDDGKAAERSRKGKIRSCIHCNKRKPDRTHHCRQCNRCNLKMDHHCNWIANCVGYYNYKYFFLIIFYGGIALTIFSATFWECVVVSLNDSKSSIAYCLYVIMTYSLLSLLTVAVDGFCVFHIWMICNNYTTIEYCEKKRKDVQGYDQSPYLQRTMLGNCKEALGDRPWLWLLPVYDRKGTGLYYLN